MGRRVLGLCALFLSLLPAQTADSTDKSQQARQLMRQGKYGEAVQIYRDLLTADPDNSSLLLSLGIAHHMAGQDKEAIDVFGAVLKVKPATFSALTMSASSYLRLGQPSKAIPLLQTALQMEPRDANLSGMLSNAYSMTGEELRLQRRYTEAIAILKKGLTLKPDDLKIQMEMAAAVYGSGNYSSAEALLRKLPSSPDVDYMLGDSLLKQKKTDAAIPFLVRAVTSDSQFLLAHASLGKAYVAAKMLIAAVPHLEKAQPIDRDGSIHYQLAQADKAAGRPADAAAAMKTYQQLSAKAKKAPSSTKPARRKPSPPKPGSPKPAKP